jgi:type IV pilus assembly protein PilM
MAKRATTLFIRDTSINLLVMKGEQVEKWASLPLDPGLVSQGLITDEEQVAGKLKQIFKETKAQTSKVMIALSGHDSLYRIITLPDLPEAVLPEAVRREAKRTMPTPLEEVYFSYQRVPSLSGETRVFLATFPRDRVDALIRTARKADIKPYVMDLAPLALARIPEEPRAIIVNARSEHLDVMVIADRLPQVIRRLSLPGESESLDDRLALIAEEFQRTAAFYNSSHMEQPLDSSVPVFVCGDLAEAPDTWQALVGQSGNSVSVLPAPVEPPEGFNANEFMVNMGLGLKELRPENPEADFSIVNFNTLPEAYLPARFSVIRVVIPVVAVIGIGAIVLAAILVLNTRANIEVLRSDVSAAEASVAQQQTQINTLEAQISPVESIASELGARSTAMERDRAVLHEDLSEIERLARDQVTLASADLGGSSIAISGSASDENDIFDYARELADSGRFSEVWISSVTGSEGSFVFALSLTK